MIDGAKPAVYERILGRKAGKMIWSGAPRAYIDTLRKQKTPGRALASATRRSSSTSKPEADPSASPPDPPAPKQNQKPSCSMRQSHPTPAQPRPPPYRPPASHRPSHRLARESD